MIERAKNDPKMHWRTNVTVSEVLGNGSVSGLRLRDTKTGEESTLNITGILICAIGHDPRSALVHGQVDTDNAGYVLTQAPQYATNIPGVFACGDLVDHTYRQAITAAAADVRPPSTPSAGSPTARSTRSSRARLRHRRGRGRGRRPLTPRPPFARTGDFSWVRTPST